MTRIRLFLFYSLMAWASAIKPTEGAKMIEDAETGALERARHRLIHDIHHNGRMQRELRTPDHSTVALAATVALMVTGGWLALLIDNLLEWTR